MIAIARFRCWSVSQNYTAKFRSARCTLCVTTPKTNRRREMETPRKGRARGETGFPERLRFLSTALCQILPVWALWVNHANFLAELFLSTARKNICSRFLGTFAACVHGLGSH